MWNTMKILMKKVVNFKVGDHARISNIKTFLLKDILQIGHKKF